jgi:hypothetical protein
VPGDVLVVASEVHENAHATHGAGLGEAVAFVGVVAADVYQNRNAGSVERGGRGVVQVDVVPTEIDDYRRVLRVGVRAGAADDDAADGCFFVKEDRLVCGHLANGQFLNGLASLVGRIGHDVCGLLQQVEKDLLEDIQQFNALGEVRGVSADDLAFRAVFHEVAGEKLRSPLALGLVELRECLVSEKICYEGACEEFPNDGRDLLRDIS